MKIVDTNNMQLEAMVNQVESEELRIGQQAEVNFDAFPDLKMKGRVYSISALAVSGWRQNYYIRAIPVNIAIQSSDPRLIPDVASGNIDGDTSEHATKPGSGVWRDRKTVVHMQAPIVRGRWNSGRKTTRWRPCGPGSRRDEIALQQPVAEKWIRATLRGCARHTDRSAAWSIATGDVRLPSSTTFSSSRS
jgi:hypothetical protein